MKVSSEMWKKILLAVIAAALSALATYSFTMTTVVKQVTITANDIIYLKSADAESIRRIDLLVIEMNKRVNELRAEDIERASRMSSRLDKLIDQNTQLIAILTAEQKLSHP